MIEKRELINLTGYTLIIKNTKHIIHAKTNINYLKEEKIDTNLPTIHVEKSKLRNRYSVKVLNLPNPKVRTLYIVNKNIAEFSSKYLTRVDLLTPDVLIPDNGLTHYLNDENHHIYSSKILEINSLINIDTDHIYDFDSNDLIPNSNYKFQINSIVKHIRSKNLYVIKQIPIDNYDEKTGLLMYQYKGLKDGRTWNRCKHEMEDGRFELLYENIMLLTFNELQKLMLGNEKIQ